MEKNSGVDQEAIAALVGSVILKALPGAIKGAAKAFSGSVIKKSFNPISRAAKATTRSVVSGAKAVGRGIQSSASSVKRGAINTVRYPFDKSTPVMNAAFGTGKLQKDAKFGLKFTRELRNYGLFSGGAGLAGAALGKVSGPGGMSTYASEEMMDIRDVLIEKVASEIKSSIVNGAPDAELYLGIMKLSSVEDEAQFFAKIRGLLAKTPKILEGFSNKVSDIISGGKAGKWAKQSKALDKRITGYAKNADFAQRGFSGKPKGLV